MPARASRADSIAFQAPRSSDSRLFLCRVRAASRRFGQTQADIQRSVERLASAKRINHSTDDAAGLAIHTRLEQQVRTAAKERTGIQQQISFAQSAQSKLNEANTALLKLREMAL